MVAVLPKFLGPTPALRWMVGGAFGVLLAYSMARHSLFHSTAYDLGYFDQATYLISQGQPPIVSFWGDHFLGGHADWILYLVAGLYRLYPTVYWLLGLQALALAVGAVPVWYLAQQARLTAAMATTLAGVYLLQPLVFNVNLFDFHPAALALPVLLGAVWAARAGRIGWFGGALIFVLGCRDTLALTVVALGVWLFWFEKRRICGAIALGLGLAWFLIATQVLIPHFRPMGVEAVARYAELGDSIPAILQNLLLHPLLLLRRLLNLENFYYFCLLLSPLMWGLSWRHLAPLVGALPPLAMNLLTDFHAQKDIVHQYSLPILPFLLLTVISTVAAGRGWWRSRRAMILWALLGFICLAKHSYIVIRYLDTLDTWQATRSAIAQVQTAGAVLTTAEMAPHLTHRPVLQLATQRTDLTHLSEFDYILLNARHPGWESNSALAIELIQRLQVDRSFELAFQQDDVFLFVKPSA